MHLPTHELSLLVCTWARYGLDSKSIANDPALLRSALLNPSFPFVKDAVEQYAIPEDVKSYIVPLLVAAERDILDQVVAMHSSGE